MCSEGMCSCICATWLEAVRLARIQWQPSCALMGPSSQRTLGIPNDALLGVADDFCTEFRGIFWMRLGGLYLTVHIHIYYNLFSCLSVVYAFITC